MYIYLYQTTSNRGLTDWNYLLLAICFDTYATAQISNRYEPHDLQVTLGHYGAAISISALLLSLAPHELNTVYSLLQVTLLLNVLCWAALVYARWKVGTEGLPQ